MKLQNRAAIMVLTYWSFKDALIQTYTLPYVKIIQKVSQRKVYLVCLEQTPHNTTIKERDEINESLADLNINVIFFDYHRFGLKQALLWIGHIIKLSVFVVQNDIQYLHAWCTPGGAIAYLLSIITGKKLILDSYEPHAELMAETNTWLRTSVAFKILFFLEKLQTQRASKIIGVVDKMQEYALHKYGVKIKNENFFVKPACVDMGVFYYRSKDKRLTTKLNLQDKIVGIYAGKVGGIYLENELFDFIKQCYIYWGGDFVMLMLTNTPDELITTQLTRLKLPSTVVMKKFVSYKDVSMYMTLGDFAVNFMKPVAARRYSTPIKDGEYWAMGLPIIITSGISDDSEIVKSNDIGYVLNNLSVTEYDKAILKIALLLKNTTINKKINLIAKKNRDFSIARIVYEKIYANTLTF